MGGWRGTVGDPGCRCLKGVGGLLGFPRGTALLVGLVDFGRKSFGNAMGGRLT